MKTNSQYLNIYSLVDYYHYYYYHNYYITSSVANIIPLKKKQANKPNPVHSLHKHYGLVRHVVLFV